MQRIHVIFEDDLDGSPADETVSFALDGLSYEIDLAKANAAALREALAPFIGAGRRIRRQPRQAPAPKGGTNLLEADPKKIRVWARKNGHAVSDYGRLPHDLVRAYAQRDSIK